MTLSLEGNCIQYGYQRENSLLQMIKKCDLSYLNAGINSHKGKHGLHINESLSDFPIHRSQET